MASRARAAAAMSARALSRAGGVGRTGTPSVIRSNWAWIASNDMGQA